MSRLAFLLMSPLVLAASVSADAKAAPVDQAAHQGHDMSTMQRPAPAPVDPHAGHDMPGMEGMAMPAAAPTDAAGQPSGTDREPGNAPPPPVAGDRPADRFYDPAAMSAAQAALLDTHGGMIFYKVLFNLAEYQARNGRDGYRWDASAWFGRDIDRLALKSEGAGTFGDAIDDGEVQALWSHAIGPYWNLQGGVRQDFGRGPDRTHATIGIEGIAPYWFDLGASAYVSTKGHVLARIEGDIDQRITQRLILQPRLEANFAAQDVPENGIGAGLSNMELGLRLRYAVAWEFAPYVGVSWDRKVGETARMARSAGERASSTSIVAGIRFWF